MPTHTQFKGVSDIGQALLSEQLEVNLYSWFSWASLGAGAFENVNIPASGAYGGDFSRLRPVMDPYYTDGQVWEGARQDWVWESGVEYGTQPIRVSGVYVDGDFHAVTSTGTYAHHVNYPLGRIVFDSAISPSSTVTAEYSYKYYGWHTSDNSWWKEIQKSSFRVDDNHFLQSASGNWSILAQHRVQLPAVIIEATPNVSRYGKEIGGLSQVVSQTCLFHILAENSHDLRQLHDIITYQQEKRIRTFDLNAVWAASGMALDERGSPTGDGRMYTDLIKNAAQGGYSWRQVRFNQMASSDVPRVPVAPLRYCMVRGIFEVDIP